MSAAVAAPKNISYIEMVSAAIKELKERKGSSRQAISKYIVKEYKLDADKAKPQLRRALKRGVDNKVLVQVKGNGASGSFKNAEVPKKAIKVKPVVKKPKSKDVKVKAKKPASKTKKVTKSPKKAAAKKTPKKTKKPAVKKPSAKKSASKKPAAKKVKKAIEKKPIEKKATKAAK